MKEIKIKDKEKYLEVNYPFDNLPQLTDKKICIHCNEIITVGNFKVYKNISGFEFICCPHAPECDGSVIDWIDLD